MRMEISEEDWRRMRLFSRLRAHLLQESRSRLRTTTLVKGMGEKDVKELIRLIVPSACRKEPEGNSDSCVEGIVVGDFVLFDDVCKHYPMVNTRFCGPRELTVAAEQFCVIVARAGRQDHGPEHARRWIPATWTIMLDGGRSAL